jgi:hypothetical protein
MVFVRSTLMEYICPEMDYLGVSYFNMDANNGHLFVYFCLFVNKQADANNGHFGW